MEEVRRVTSTKKTKKSTIILLVVAGVLGLALIGTAIYFYAIGDTSKTDVVSEKTCACYYIDPAVVSECGDPRRGFLFELKTVPGDQVCSAGCSTNNLSVNLLNSSTQRELYQICQLPTVTDTRCNSMIVKDKSGKIVTGTVASDEELTIEAKFDKEYTGYKFVINNEDTQPDIISADKLTTQKTLTQLTGTSLSIVATATDANGEQINSPICRRFINIDSASSTNVTDIQIETRDVDSVKKISRIRIGVGNVDENANLRINFSFDNNLPDLLMTTGYTIDSAKGEVVILEQDLYDSTNFNTDTNFSQLDGSEDKVTITASLTDDNGAVGTVNGTVDFSVTTSSETDGEEAEESNFEVSKTSNIACVERVAPSNIAQFTITAVNKTSATQNITSILDKLPLGFTYTANSTKINGVSVTDNEYVTTNTTGSTQEIVWTKTNGWPVPSGQSLVIVFQSEVGESALTGDNQNEVVVTPEEVPADPTSLRAELVIEVAQSCGEEEQQQEDQEDTTPVTEDQSTTPDTGLFDSVITKAILGIITILIGWFIYSKPQGQLLIEKLVDSGVYKEAEVTSWRIFKPKKYFEEKTIRKLKKKD